MHTHKSIVDHQNDGSVTLNMVHDNPEYGQPVIGIVKKTDGAEYIVPGGKTYKIRGDAVKAAIPMFRACGYRTARELC